MRTFWHSNRLHPSCDEPESDERVRAEEADANLVSSLMEDGQHMPVLDIDVPARLIDSSTPYHSHLYIDVPMSWEQYVKLLDVLAEVGILEERYVMHSKRRGATFVRKPGVKKEVPDA